MSKTLINVTQYSIVQEIERVLEQCPDHPHQQLFAHPDLRQELLVWVLNRIPNSFTLHETLEALRLHPTYSAYSANAQSCTEFVIRQAIQEIMAQEQQVIEHSLPKVEDAELAASHWFG